MARVRPNGGVLGPPITVSGTSASGMFSIVEANLDKQAGNFPQYIPVATAEPQFNLNTLLLHGDGSNAANNNTFLDSSTNAFTITSTGSPAQGTFSPFSQTGWSNYFGGQQILSVGSGSTAFNLTGNFTVEAWVYVTVLAAGDWGIIDARASGQTATAWLMTISSGGKIQFYDGSAKQGTTTVTQNVWHHIVWQRTGSVLRGFLDGVLDYYNASYGTGALSPGTTTPAIGTKDYSLSGYGTTGYISNLRLVNGSTVYSTSASTVGTSVFTPSTTPLTTIANTTLLACQDNRFRDNSVNNFAITIGAGTPGVQPFSPFAPAASYGVSSVGGSVYFNGSTDYLTIPNNTSLGMGAADFTIEFWLYQTALSSYKQILDVLDGNSAGRLILWVDSGGTLYNLGYNGTSRHTTAGGAIVTNTWTHVALVRSSGTTKFYINGTQSGTNYTDSTNYTCTTGSVYIGINSDGGTYPYVGYLSNFRMVKGTAVYTGTFTPPTAPVTAIANTSLLVNGTNAAIYDSTAKNNVITVSSAQISTSQSKFGGSSMYFNGSSYITMPTTVNLQLGTGDFTIETWSYLTSRGSSYPCIFGNYNSFTTGALAIFAGHASSSSTAYQVAYNGSFPAIAGGTITYNTWNHIALVRSSGTLTLYINGTVTGTPVTGATAALNGVSTVTYIGTTGDSISSGYIAGFLDEFRISKYARYTSAFTPATTVFLNQ